MMLDSVNRGAGGADAPPAAVDDDVAGDGMQCSNHPYRANSPGGICAFCLQEKLGKLVSSSSSSFFIASSSSSPSFRSGAPTAAGGGALRIAADTGGVSVSSTAAELSLSLSTAAATATSSNGGSNKCRYQEGCNSTKRTRMPFLLTQKKKKRDPVVLKRCKSTATPRSGRYLPSDSEDFSPRRRGFWSFLHLSHKKPDRSPREPKVGPVPASVPAVASTSAVVVEEAESSPNSSGRSNTASFGRKVSRSRSVGCGSRSFSGDFFERISTGFGDCTLRRVESQREGKRYSSASRAGDAMKERVRCGGLFGGFMVTSSSSSSSSSSYLVPSNSAEEHLMNGRPAVLASTPGAAPLVHGRSRSWGWALASPMRAFGKPSMKDGNRDLGATGSKKSNTTTTPDLAAIPSLLAVRV